jgi:hypothetical protein
MDTPLVAIVKNKAVLVQWQNRGFQHLRCGFDSYTSCQFLKYAYESELGGIEILNHGFESLSLAHSHMCII